MQLYVLKLLKIQTKYLGRQWRKSNMKTMSAIYQKVRHRLNDDWAYGNGKELRKQLLWGVFAPSFMLFLRSRERPFRVLIPPGGTSDPSSWL